MQNNLGYTAEQAGLALMPGGLALMVLMPVAAAAAKSDRRWVIGFGFLLTGFRLYYSTLIYLGVTFQHMMWLRIVQMLGLLFIFVNITVLNYVGVPEEKHNQVSGMVNFSRSLGGSIGISLLNTFMTREEQMQQVNMPAHTNLANSFFARLVNGLAGHFASLGFSRFTSHRKALTQFAGMIAQQAIVVSDVNAFRVMAGVVACLTSLVLLLRKPGGEEEAAAASAHDNQRNQHHHPYRHHDGIREDRVMENQRHGEGDSDHHNCQGQQ